MSRFKLFPVAYSRVFDRRGEGGIYGERNLGLLWFVPALGLVTPVSRDFQGIGQTLVNGRYCVVGLV